MIQRIIDLIDRYHKFLITAHVKLDGDALGSELALCRLLGNLGKDAVVYNQDPTPRSYRFLPGADDIVHVLPAPAATPGRSITPSTRSTFSFCAATSGFSITFIKNARIRSA